jgi:hypothetical protein
MEPTSPQTPQIEVPEVDAELVAIEAAKARLTPPIAYRPLILTIDDGTGTGKTMRVAFRRPNPAEWHRYRSDASNRDPEVQANALQVIVVPCAFYPAFNAFQKLIADRPGLIELFGGKLVDFAGLDALKKVELL